MLEEKELDGKYWDQRYLNQTTGWDLGEVSPAFKLYIDTLPDKNAAILIPGCGNAYEAEYLLQNNFTNITLIDISESLTQKLEMKYKNNPFIQILHGDFFNHQGEYDFIFEQTFFCAISPNHRPNYVRKMRDLLKANGRIVGLLFNIEFEQGPPFGGNKLMYESLFQNHFIIHQMDISNDSVKPRAGNELWIDLQKK